MDFAGKRTGFGRHGVAPVHKGKLLTSNKLYLVILQLLSEKPSYGYEIIKAIEGHSSGVYSPSPGMIYPVLTYLEEVGHAVSRVDGNKKLFELTGNGFDFLDQNHEALVAILDELKEYGEKIAYFQNQMEQEELASARWGRSNHGRDGLQLRMELHELRNELKAALFEKNSASIEEKKRVLDVLRTAIAEIRGQKA